MRRIGIVAMALASLLFLAYRTLSGPKRADPRYAMVAGEQLKHRIDFLFVPEEVNRDDSDLVKNIFLPAVSLIAYSGSDSPSPAQK